MYNVYLFHVRITGGTSKGEPLCYKENLSISLGCNVTMKYVYTSCKVYQCNVIQDYLILYKINNYYYCY